MENSAQLATQLADYDSKRRSSVDVLNEAMGKYGVPEIRSRVSGLRTTLTNTENALNAVDPSVTGRTQGSLVTEAQRQKQVSNEREPIAEQYGSLSRGLGDAQSNLSDQERAAQLLAQGQLNDYESGRSALSGRYELAVNREAEQRRREEADRAYQLQLREAARQASAGSGYSFGGGTASGTPAAASKTDPLQQVAYNDVYTRVSKNNDRDLISDYNATKSSAQRGNAKDKLKLEIYAALRPDLFGLTGNRNNTGAPLPGLGSPAKTPVKSVGNTLFKGSTKPLGF